MVWYCLRCGSPRLGYVTDRGGIACWGCLDCRRPLRHSDLYRLRPWERKAR